MAWVRMPDNTRRKIERVDKAAARADLNELLAIRDGALPDRQRRSRQVTFADVLAAWRETGCPAVAGRGNRVRHRQTKADTTLYKIDGIVRKWLVPAIGPLWVDRTQTARLEAVFDDMDDRGLASSTIAKAWQYLNMALNYGRRRGLISTNPAEAVMLPERRESDRPRRALTVEQMQRLVVDAIPQDERPALWLTGLMCGLRPGELVGLRWPALSLDTDLPTIDIRERAHFYRGGYVDQRAPKKDSRRILQLHPLNVAALIEHRDTLALLGRYDPDGFVFPTRNGTPIGMTALRIYLRRLFDRAGLGTEWTTYELRHSFVSLADDALEDLRKVADVVGHVETTTTLGYRHQVRPSIPHGVEAWNRLLSGGERSEAVS